MSIRRILIASDPLMTKETEQFSNRRWMKDLLSRPIEEATGIAPETLASSRTNPDLLDRRRFFSDSGVAVDMDATQFWFDEATIGPASRAYLGEFVGPDCLVVGYELSAQTRAILSDLGAAWVDLWLHPVRFLDDILFAVNASNGAVRERLFDYDIPPRQMQLYADRIRIQTYKGWRRIEAPVKPDSALFVGQMLNDKSVCDRGRMLSLLDYRDRFEDLARDHACVYYSRHPYMRTGDQEILDFIRRHPRAEMIDCPSYRVLSSHRIQTVTGISSSVVEEARYFGKTAEHLFRPVLSYGDPDAPDSGASILQDIVSPHFWADCLSPLMPTRPCPEIRFVDPKDKLRDMLGFYWSYADIDKTEHLRQTANRKPAVGPRDRTSDAPRKPSFAVASGFTQTPDDMGRLCAAIESHDVVSFDIFDTLIERMIDQPGDLFTLMAPEVARLTCDAITDFPARRRAARDLALADSVGEEVPLDARYRALARTAGLSPDMATTLHGRELDWERRLCRRRFAGCAALEHAKTAGKRILLISDIFFDRDFVETLLGQCGITGWDRLYLSSEEGVLKQTGRLFDRVLEIEGLDPTRILHIGDNATADIARGAGRGLSTFHLPDKAALLKRASPLGDAYSAVADPATRSVLRACLARDATAAPMADRHGFTGGEAEAMGYRCLGPALFAFARWIDAQARDAGLSHLFFLSRDGDIAMKAWTHLTQDDPDAPASSYVLASRRALNTARLHSRADIRALLERNFTPCPLAALIENRFGLDPARIPVEAYRAAGFNGPADIADWKVNEAGIARFFLCDAVTDRILANAAEERDRLTAYYTEAGLGPDSGRVGFVDIGHAGSLQAAIQVLTGCPETLGLYFATSSDIDATLPEGHHTGLGFAGDRLDPGKTRHPYMRHILMFELMFQNDQGSFLRIGPEGPEFLETTAEARRVDFARQLHAGALRFVRDFATLERDLGVTFALSGEEAIDGLSRLFSAPWPRDAALLRGVGFENRYSARDMRWILPPGGTSGPLIWAEGRAALMADTRARDGAGLSEVLVRASAALVRNDRKRAKLLRDPHAFFADSRRAPLRALARFV